MSDISGPADSARATANAKAEAQLVARAGHDMRQPLHALALFHAALRRRATDEQTASILLRAEQASAALSRVMLGVLSLAEVNAAEGAPAFEVVAMEEVFVALEQELAPDISAATLALEGGGAALTARDALQAILRSLILYAAASGGDIRLGAKRESDRCVIGFGWIGVLAEDVEALLTNNLPRAAATPRTARDGMDLALLVAARQAEALGVAIEAKQIGERVAIRIALPAAP
jgi:light-regulated signal transduction histidine kinase (bacteriophytochrome)